MQEITKEMIMEVIQKGGASFKNGKLVNLKSGFMASVRGSESKIAISNIDWIFTVVNNYTRNGVNMGYVGLWVENGFVYVDFSKRFKSKNAALVFGRKNNQIAIFDNKKGLAIYC